MINWDEQPLGNVNDSELARQLGVTPGSVRQARIRRGIPRATAPGRASAVDWDAVPLGERTDAAIARELGVSRSCVSGARKRRGIPRYRANTAK